MKVVKKIKKGIKKFFKSIKNCSMSIFKNAKKTSKNGYDGVLNFFKNIGKKNNLDFKCDKKEVLKEKKIKQKKNNDSDKSNIIYMLKEKNKNFTDSLKSSFKKMHISISKGFKKILPKWGKSKKKKKTFINEDNIFLYTFSAMMLSLVICFLNPFNSNMSSLALSNQVDTENIESNIEKAKVEVENRIIRSFPFYDDVLKGYFGATMLMNESKYKNANDDELILVNSKRNIYTNKDRTRFIIRYNLDEKDGKKHIDSRIKTFNEIYDRLAEKKINLSIYTVNGIWTSEAILNFDVDEKEPLKYVNMFKEGINENIKFDYLKIIDFTTFKKYFFKTDHHWTMMGAYQGYKDIAKMYGVPEEELVKPNFYKVKDIKFIGSNARACAYDKIYDEIYDIEFDEKYKIKENGKSVKIEDFTEKEKYLSGDFDKEEFYNHYGKYFRHDTGEVIYTFDKNKDKKKNILIMADSFSNCIEQVIASHFYKTYVLDIRYYDYYMKKPFNLYEYVEKNNIDEVLFMYSANCIYFDSMDFKME